MVESRYIAGVDVGNNSTEVAVARLDSDGRTDFLAGALVRTVGIKGTVRNVLGIIDALDKALVPVNMTRRDLDVVLINEATPVIGDVAMETITETIITESAMIGHNPSTPGGLGLGIGLTVPLAKLTSGDPGREYIPVISGDIEFREAAALINRAAAAGFKVVGAIAQKDDGVLIHNRLNTPVPIVDEVKFIDRVPLNMPAAIEVAGPGRTIEKLSNPYDIATLFELTPDDTRRVVPIARALTGNRSAVVVKTPKGDIQERRIPAGSIKLIGDERQVTVPVEDGAEVIMDKLAQVAPLKEIEAESGTHAGGMFEKVRQVMADLTSQPVSAIQIQDVLAVDTLKPQQVIGSLAGEFFLGAAVGLAAMVKTHKLPMQRLAARLEEEIQIRVDIGGVEAEMAIRGALTTPGAQPPLAVLDLGGGSTDASVINEKGDINSIHLAGAGDMVTLLIDTELDLNDRELAENIKRFPLAKVETLFHMRHEDGKVEFFQKHLDPKLFGRVVVLTEAGPTPLEIKVPLNKIAEIRRRAKSKVFVTNALRALRSVAPSGNIRLIHFVTLVGGSALDFEIPKMISDALIEYGVVVGRANVRGLEGPRNAVATGLCLAYGGKGDR
jgi:diol dehydratase reactivase alpha subunit